MHLINSTMCADLQKMKVSTAKIRKVCVYENTSMPSSLGGKLIVVVRQVGRQADKIQNF